MEDENVKAKWFADRILETAIALVDCINNKDYDTAYMVNENIYELSSKLERATTIQKK